MNKIRQAGFTAVEGIIIVVAVILLGGIGYFVYDKMNKSDDTSKTSNNESSNNESTPPQNNQETDQEQNKETVVDEQTYKITLPEGWQKTDQAPNAYVGGLVSAVENGGYYSYYTDGSGNYFAVSVNPAGRGFDSNETWELTATNNGYTVASKSTCIAGEDFCTPANLTEYRVAMKDTELAKLKSNNYFFFAGNTTKKTGVDVSLYQSILSSFTVK